MSREPRHPPGWKSRAALDAERRGLVDAANLSERLKVPIKFIQDCAPKHEWHHVRKSTYIGRRYYYEPRSITDWFHGKRGQSAWKQWQGTQHDKCVLRATMLTQLRTASEGKLIVCFPGVGSAFAKKNAHTSAIIGKNGKLVLVDCGATVPAALHEKGMNVTDFDGYYFTHSHSDHVGGVEEIFLKSRYVTKKKVSVLITENYQEELWESTLKGGCEYSDAGRLRFADYAVPVRPKMVCFTPREMYKAEFHGINLGIFRTKHMGNVADGEKSFWSTGLIVESNVIFTGDTRFDPDLYNQTAGWIALRLTTIFQDCQLFDPGAVHATFSELSRLPDHLKERMLLMHYGDNWETHQPPQEAGFKGWVKPWEIYEFPLLG